MKMYEFRKCTMFLEKLILNLRISRTIGDLKRSQSALFGSITHTEILFVFTCVTNVWNQSIQAFVSQALVHFVIDRANFFTDQIMKGLPIRAKYRHFRTIWEHTCDNSPTDFISTSLKWWSSMQRNFVELLSRLLCQLKISFHTLLCMTFHILRPWRNTNILRVWTLLCSHRGISRFKHGSVILRLCAMLFQLFLLFLICVVSTCNDSRRSSRAFAEFQGVNSVNDCTLPIGLQELFQASLSSLWSFVLNGYVWIHQVARSCTTTSNRRLFRDSHLSLKTLWSAVIKSPKFSARGTAPPLRPLHGSLVICPLADLAISVVKRNDYRHCLQKNLTSLECGL